MATRQPTDLAAEPFSGLLLRHRGRTRLTQRELASRLGLHMRSIQAWEAGANYPSAQRLEALIAVFPEAGGLTVGREAVEAEALWAAALRDAPRMQTPFDRAWFAALLAAWTASSTPAHPLPPARLSTAQRNDEASRGASREEEKASRERHGDVTILASAPDVTRKFAAERRHELSEAPDVRGFLGRTDELATLQGWILDERCRLVALLGMGGIGKTMLAARLAHRVVTVERVYWRSMRNAPPLGEWLGAAIGFLSDQQLVLPEGEQSRLEQLLQLLRGRRSLLVLDNFETLLEPGSPEGSYRDGYAGYGRLLEAIGQAAHLSCLLLTSREAPAELAVLGGAPSVRALEVHGLGVAEAQPLLQHKQLSGDATDWGMLVDRFGGNGLALRLADENIRQVFGGELRAFFEQAGSGVVFGGIKRLLDEQVERSSAVERSVLKLLAIEREPVRVGDLLADLGPHIGRGDAMEAIEALRRRSLVERADTVPAFTLQSVVLELVTERLVEQVAEEIAHGQPDQLVQHPLIKALAKEYVRQCQERLIGQPIIQRLIAEYGAPGTERLLLELLERWRAGRPAEVGYGPGNAINLLRLVRGELCGADLSRLSIREAYLQEVAMRDSSLAGAEVRETVLGEAFEAVTSLAISADGARVAAGLVGGEVRVWRVVDRAPVCSLHGHIGPVTGVAFSPDGQLVVSGSHDATVRLWTVEGGRQLAILQGHGGGVRGVAFSPDGRLVASGSYDATVRIWAAQTGRQVAVLHGHAGGAMGVAFSPDRRVLASASMDGSVRLWGVEDGRCLAVLEGHTAGVWGVAFSADGRLLASGSLDATVRLWDVESRQPLDILEGHNGPVRDVAFSSDGQLLASGGLDKTVRLWAVETGLTHVTLQGHAGPITGLGFSPDGRLVASGSHDATVRLWSAQSGQTSAILRGHGGGVVAVAFSPDGRQLASGGFDTRVQLWAVDSGQPLAILSGHLGPVVGVAFSPDGQLLASGSYDATVRLWPGHGGRPLATLEGHGGGVVGVTFSPDGQLLASGSLDATVRLWSVRSGETTGVLQGHGGGVIPVAFSRDGRLLASGSLDGTARLWAVPSGQPRATLEGHTSAVTGVAFSPDAQLLASSSYDATVRIWAVESGRCLGTLEGHGGGVVDVAFGPDGRMVASASHDTTVRVWVAQSGQLLGTLEGHSSEVFGVAFSPDGSLLASGSLDGTARLWDLHQFALLRTLRPDRSYERMDITGLTGVTGAQRAALVALGAVERSLLETGMPRNERSTGTSAM